MKRAERRYKLGVQVQQRYPAIVLEHQTIVEYFFLLEELDRDSSMNG